MFLRSLFNKWQHEQLNNKPTTPSGPTRRKPGEDGSRPNNAPPGFGKPGSEGPKRGLGHIQGPGVRIGRKTNVGNINKARRQHGI